MKKKFPTVRNVVRFISFPKGGNPSFIKLILIGNNIRFNKIKKTAII